MSVYCWDFEITQLPAPPKGIKHLLPPPELASTTNTKTAIIGTIIFDFGDNKTIELHGFPEKKWIVSLYKKNIKVCSQIQAAIHNGITNLSSPIWRRAIRLVGYEPAYKTVKLQAKAQWEQIYANHIQNAESEHQIQVKTGVTNSESQTNSFTHHVGISTTVS